MASVCDAAKTEISHDLAQPIPEAEEGAQPTPLQLRYAKAEKRAKELGVPCLLTIWRAADTARAAGPEQFEELLCEWIRQGELDTAMDYMGPRDAIGGATLVKDDPAGASKALLHAVSTANFRAAQVLLEERHADVGARDVFGTTTLMQAAGFGMAAFTRALLERGADLHAADTISLSTALHHVAAASGNADVAQLLLEWGARPDAKDGRDRTPLIIAAVNGRTALVKVLLAAGADPLATSRDGISARSAPREFTAIHKMLRAAIFRRRLSGVRQLLRKLPLVSRGPPAPAAADRRAAQGLAAV